MHKIAIPSQSVQTRNINETLDTLITAPSNRHYFGESRLRANSNMRPSPKKSDSGIYYMKCHNCGRSVFGTGGGSATQSPCVY